MLITPQATSSLTMTTSCTCNVTGSRVPREDWKKPISQIALVDYCPHLDTHWDAGSLAPVSLSLFRVRKFN